MSSKKIYTDKEGKEFVLKEGILTVFTEDSFQTAIHSS